jgi:hypothetical protein
MQGYLKSFLEESGEGGFFVLPGIGPGEDQQMEAVPGFGVAGESASLRRRRRWMWIGKVLGLPRGADGLKVNGNYERTDDTSKATVCAEGGTGHLLLVRVREVEEPAVLRRFTCGNGVQPGEGGDQQGGDGGVVRMQTFGPEAVL